MIGATISHYRIIDKLGQGGMGEVYRASDTKLGRDVAIKVLPASFADDPDRLSRFEREARLLATLSHPHIAAIYGIEEVGNSHALILELVDGPTLTDRLTENPLTVKEALSIACQIAEALEAAHGKGIIHRDLKPANIKVTSDGTVKVLDFGLAKSFMDETTGPDMSRSPTVTSTGTREGVILGTVPYMSPEQARGKAVDKRTDIWAFGCVLMEMLTGRMAFGGATASDTIAKILEREPEWERMPATTPANIRVLLRRCLEKDPNRRLRDIGDARIELEETLSGKATTEEAKAVRKRAYWPAVAAGFVLGGTAIGVWAWLGIRAAPAPEIVRFTHQLPPGHRMIPAWNPSLMFSPDGKSLAFNYAVDGIPTAFQRPIDELEQKPLGGVENLATPVFSPDGRWVVMNDNMDLTLKKIAVEGGAPVPLTGTDMFGRGDWGRDGYIYFTDRYPGAILRIPENGGAKEPVTTLDPQKEEFAHKHAQILPGGKAIMFTVVSSGMESYNDARIELQILGTKERKILVQGGFCPRYSPSGHIVYAKAGNLYAMPFDAGKLEPTGPPIKVVEGVQMSTNTGAAYFDISGAGALAYVPGVAEGGARTLVWVDRHGNAEPLPLEARSYLFPRISPDGKTILFEVEGATHNLYSYDLARTVTTKLTIDGLSHAPLWTPDGKNICFRSWKAGTMTMWEMPADRSQPEKRLTTVGARQSAVSVSPDERYLAYNQMGEMKTGSGTAAMDTDSGTAAMGTGSDIWILPLQGADRTPKPFANKKFDEASPKFSPDGKWVAYCSNEEGKTQVFIQAWPGPGWKLKLSLDGGTDPLWNQKPGANEIFYRNGDQMMVVPIKFAGAQPDAGKPVELWKGHYSHGMSSSCGPPGVSSANYDVTADGQRFLMIRDNNQDVYSTKIIVVLNWTEELKRKKTTAKQ